MNKREEEKLKEKTKRIERRLRELSENEKIAIVDIEKELEKLGYEESEARYTAFESIETRRRMDRLGKPVKK